MRMPRLRVRTLMVAVAVVAVNFGLIRGAEGLDADASPISVLLPAYGLVPSLSLLTVAVANAALGLVKRGHAPPFSTGYILLGGLASFGVCLALAAEPFLFYVTVRGPDPVPGPAILSDNCAVVLEIVLWGLPQVSVALIGGALAARYGLTIVLGRTDAKTREELPFLATVSVSSPVPDR